MPRCRRQKGGIPPILPMPENLHAVYVGFHGYYNAHRLHGFRVTCCLIINEKTGRVEARGLSCCSPLDQFDRKEGRFRACERAKYALRTHECRSEMRREKVKAGVLDAGFTMDPYVGTNAVNALLPTPFKAELNPYRFTSRELLAIKHFQVTVCQLPDGALADHQLEKTA
jgi:hypothetical protein